MPPKRITEDASQNLKEKLSALQGTNARGRRNGGVNAINGSNLKEVDNASSNSGQVDFVGSSNVSEYRPAWQHYKTPHKCFLLTCLYYVD